MEELAGWLLQPLRRSFSLRRRVAVAVRSPSRVPVRPARKAAGGHDSTAVRRRTRSFPVNTNEVCGGDIVDAIDCEAGPLQRRQRLPPSNDIAESIETKDNKTLHGQAQAATSSTTAPRSRPRTSSMPGTTPRTARTGRPTLLLRTDRGLRRFMWPNAPTRTAEQDAEGQEMTRSEGGRRQDLHDPDHRAGLEPAGAAGLHRLRATAGLVLLRSQGLSRRSRSGPVRSSWTARPTPRSCSRSSPTTRANHQAQRGQGDLPDLPGSGAAYADVVANNLDLHSTSHSAGPARWRACQGATCPTVMAQRESGPHR